MNNTYLIFFGKSQDFTYHSFDSKSYIGNNLDIVIRDFDELESKIFTTDDVSNTQILSKYIFEKNGKQYSLLKLYSLAQAFNGSRIDGSIYGVALLSENDIKISDFNTNILKAAKEEFAKLSLNGVKFKNSDFHSEGEKIWTALTNHSNGNYIEKIEFNHFAHINISRNLKAFLVKDVLKQSAELNDEITKTSRLYFSDDLAHLKRTQERRGKDFFPVYHKENGAYILYKEKQPERPKPQHRETSGTEDLRLENGRLNRQIDDTERKFKQFRQDAAKKIRIVSIAAAVFCLTAFTFFFKDVFNGNQHNSETDTATVEKNPSDNNNTPYENQPQSGVVDITTILVDDSKRNTLADLLQTIKQSKQTGNNKKIYNEIVSDINILGINPTFADKFKPEEKPNAPSTPPAVVEKPKTLDTKKPTKNADIKDKTNKRDVKDNEPKVKPVAPTTPAEDDNKNEKQTKEKAKKDSAKKEGPNKTR